MSGEDPKEPRDVTMRVRIGGNEIEVTGPKDFVEKKIAEFIEQNSQFPSASPSPAPSEDEPILPKGTSIAQFFRKISLKTDVDRVLAAGYFLEKFKDQDSFTANEVREIIRAAKVAPPKNPSDAVSKNIKKGYIMPSGDRDGKMAFTLTSDGEEAISESLKT